ncbi:MAG: hypothetical protein HC831_18065 [Chloroflexia bacterium]|nr:hypothetical protein [Chloroflexia bacterium]
MKEYKLIVQEFRGVGMPPPDYEDALAFPIDNLKPYMSHTYSGKSPAKKGGFLPDDTSRLPAFQNERYEMEWKGLVKKMSKPEICVYKHHASMFNLCDFSGGTTKYNKGDVARWKSNIKKIYAIILDYDEGQTWKNVKEGLKNYEYFAYSSFNNNWDKKNKCIDKSIEKFRVVLPLKKPVEGKGDDQTDIDIRKKALTDFFRFGKKIDESTFTASRVFYRYSSSPDVERKACTWFEHNEGELLDLYSFEASEFKELEPGEIIEYNDSDRQGLLEAIKSLPEGVMHQPDVFRLITICKTLSINKASIQDAMNGKIDPSSTADFHDSYKKAKVGGFNMGPAKALIKSLGGDVSSIKQKESTNRQEVLEICEPILNDREDLKKIESDIEKRTAYFLKDPQKRIASP